MQDINKSELEKKKSLTFYHFYYLHQFCTVYEEYLLLQPKQRLRIGSFLEEREIKQCNIDHRAVTL